MFTREQGTTALNRILREVLLYKDESPDVLALDVAGITNLTDFMSLRYEVIRTLVYQPQSGGKPKPLKPNDVGMIRTFIAHGRHLMQANGGILSIEQWDAITPEEFDEFRIRGQAQVYDVQEVFFDVNYAHVTLEETALFDQKTNPQDESNFLHDEVSKRAMCAHELEDCTILQSKYNIRSDDSVSIRRLSQSYVSNNNLVKVLLRFLPDLIGIKVSSIHE